MRPNSAKTIFVLTEFLVWNIKGCKNIVIKKLEFVAKNHFLSNFRGKVLRGLGRWQFRGQSCHNSFITLNIYTVSGTWL